MPVLEEALDKIRCGAKILIREGSAAKNYPALWPLLKTHPESVMFCSDDKHPDDLVTGHINELVTRALRDGVPLANALTAACVNPVEHYRLPVGLLRVGDSGGTPLLAFFPPPPPSTILLFTLSLLFSIFHSFFFPPTPLLRLT